MIHQGIDEGGFIEIKKGISGRPGRLRSGRCRQRRLCRLREVGRHDRASTHLGTFLVTLCKASRHYSQRWRANYSQEHNCVRWNLTNPRAFVADDWFQTIIGHRAIVDSNQPLSGRNGARGVLYWWPHGKRRSHRPQRTYRSAPHVAVWDEGQSHKSSQREGGHCAHRRPWSLWPWPHHRLEPGRRTRTRYDQCRYGNGQHRAAVERLGLRIAPVVRSLALIVL